MTKSLAILVLGALSVLATGCGSPIDTAPDGVSAIGRGAATDQLLTPDATGWVDKSATGTTEIQGQWHAFDDGRFGVTGVTAESCQTTKYGECSIVGEPAPGSAFAPTAGLGMCTSGIIARWIAGSDGLTPDRSPGSAGIVLELNMPDWPEPRTSVNAPNGQSYDADAHGVTGFAFDIDSEPAPGAQLVVQVASVGPPARPWPDSNPAYWGGTRLDRSPVHAGHNEFRWDDVGPIPFYPKAMLRIGFLVSGNDSHAVPYNFCINHLTALRSSGAPPDADPSISQHLATDDQLLLPDENGWVALSRSGKTGIQGLWFVGADSLSFDKAHPPPCREAGEVKCSVVSEPNGPPEEIPRIVPPTADLRMCTSGVVAKFGSNGIWGAMMAFALNVTDLEHNFQPYNAERYGVAGFAFDIDSEPAPGAEIGVVLTTEETQLMRGASWGGRTSTFSPVHAGHNEFKWKDVGGPMYGNPPPFESTKLMGINFTVSPNAKYPVSYRFCIKNLTALRH